MRFRIAAIAAAIAYGAAVSCSSPALADDDPLLKIYQKCIGSQATNTAWEECGSDLVAGRERQMDAALKAIEPLLKAQSPSAFDDLQKQQQAWKQYEDVACNFWRSDFLGREANVMEFGPCQAGVVYERTQHLQDIEKALKDAGKQ